MINKTEQKIDQKYIDRLKKDPRVYLSAFCKIKTKDIKGGLQPFKLNKAQLKLFDELEKNNRVVILKSRQIGFSTAACGYIYHKAITNPGVNAVIIGYERDAASVLLETMKIFWETTPKEFRPTLRINNKYEMTFPKIKSSISVLPSTSKAGRGRAIHFLLCVSGDTDIVKPNGCQVNIKDLKPGEPIINGNGGVSVVKEVLKKPNKDKLVSIKTFGSIKDLKTTEDHEILVREHKTGRPYWKKAKDITKKDYLAYPIKGYKDRTKTLNIPHRTGSKHTKDVIKTDYNFGQLIGLYLAEGTITKSRRKFTLSIHKKEVDYVVNLLKNFKEYYSSYSVYHCKESKTAMVVVYGKNLSMFISDYFGISGDKHINDNVLNWTSSFLKGLLWGFVYGDGSIRDMDKIILTNTNKNILNQFKKIIISLRIGYPSFRQRKVKSNEKDSYDLILMGSANRKFRRIYKLEQPKHNTKRWAWLDINRPNANYGRNSWRRGNKYYWAKVTKIEVIDKEDFVYDVVLDKEPHSFLTTSGVVHNCTELAFWDNAEEVFTGLSQSVPEGGLIIVESTPSGRGNLYHRLYTNPDNGYKKLKFMWNWEYTQEQMDKKKAEIGDRKFQQEYNCNFLTSGSLVFGSEDIQKQESNIIKTKDTFEWKNLRIYVPPKRDGRYIVGVDTAEGLSNGDYSCAIIIDRDSGEEVAMFKAHISTDEFARRLNEWGRKYNNALLIVESNNHGLTVLTELRNMGYPMLYFQKQYGTRTTQATNRLGWKTTIKTKRILIDNIDQALREGEVVIHSQEIIDELMTFEYTETGRSNIAEAAEGYHDDAVIALGLALEGYKEMVSSKQFKELTQIDESKHVIL